MKNIFYLLLFAVATFACDPLDETYEELDKTATDPTAVQVFEITLTEDDYELLEDEGVAQYGNFESEDEAKTYIPMILNELYPQLGDGSSILVTYDLYDPVRINDEVSITLEAADYDAIDEPYGTLSSNSDIIKAVKYVYPNPSNEDVVTLTYEYYSGTTETRTSKLVFLDQSWFIAYEPTEEDYEFMGQSYPNFESRSLARERIAVLFDRLFPFAEEGDIRTSVFTYTYEDDNDTPDDDEDDFRVFEDFLAVFTFNGENWVPQQDAMPRTLQFGNEDGVWVPDNTVRYTFSAADYTLVGQNANIGSDAARDNLNAFGNFNINSGYWSSDDILDAIGFILKERFPNSEVGQKYLVTYNTYPAGNLEMHVILNADGEYELVK